MPTSQRHFPLLLLILLAGSSSSFSTAATATATATATEGTEERPASSATTGDGRRSLQTLTHQCKCSATALGISTGMVDDSWCIRRSDLLACSPPWGVTEKWYSPKYCQCALIPSSQPVHGVGSGVTSTGGGDAKSSATPLPCQGVTVSATNYGALSAMDRSRSITAPIGPVKIETAKGAAAKVEVFNTVIDKFPRGGDAPRDDDDKADAKITPNVFAVRYVDEDGVSKCGMVKDLKRGEKVGSFEVKCEALTQTATLEFLAGRADMGHWRLLMRQRERRNLRKLGDEWDADVDNPCDELFDRAPAFRVSDREDESAREKMYTYTVSIDCRSDCVPDIPKTSSDGSRCESNLISIHPDKPGTAQPGSGEMIFVTKAEDIKVAAEVRQTVLRSDRGNAFAVQYDAGSNMGVGGDIKSEFFKDKKPGDKITTAQPACDLFGKATLNVAVLDGVGDINKNPAIKRLLDEKNYAKFVSHPSVVSYTVSLDCRSDCHPAGAPKDGTGSSWKLVSAPPPGGIRPCDPSSGDICISSSDFDAGTYRIRTPGRYVLTEDVVFDPNPPTDPTNLDSVLQSGLPTEEQFANGDYDRDAYSKGFFAGFAIEVDGVEIDLNGFTMEQSVRHALLQRFWAAVECADRPFIVGQGPGMFGRSFFGAKGVRLHNGRIGLSSHHGVHGNGCADVWIHDVVFDNFEVAAAALNGVDGLTVERCLATNRKDVPVLATYNAALLLRPFCAQAIAANVELSIQGVNRIASDICSDLDESIYHVYKDVVLDNKGMVDRDLHPDEYGLYHNRHGVIDGNMYGFLTNFIGIAIHGFPSNPDLFGGKLPSTNVVFRDCVVRDMVVEVDETEALRLGRGRSDGIATDAAHAVFQTRNAHPDNPNIPLTISTLKNDTAATYVGNVVTNAQVLIAKCWNLGLCDASRNKIPKAVIDFVEVKGRTLRDTLVELVDGEPLGPNNTNGYVCNLDSVGHVGKGLVGFKMDATEGLYMENCRVDGATSAGKSGSLLCGPDYGLAVSTATYAGAGGPDLRAFSLAGTERAVLIRCSASNLRSMGGCVFAYDVHTDSSDICLEDFESADLSSLGNLRDRWSFEGEYKLGRLDTFGVHIGPEVHGVSLARERSSGLSSGKGRSGNVMNEGNAEILKKCPFLKGK